MNDFDLESKLKNVRVPARTEEYWEHFPATVRAQLRPALVARRQNKFSLQLAWSGGIAVACVLFAPILWPTFNVVLKSERVFHRDLAQLPSHLRVLMADEHGMHYLIADQP